jgi:hypothetical protein
MLSRMALKSPTSVKLQRPARIRVPNRERVLLTIRDHRFVGVLQRLSLTGGSVIHTEDPLPQGTLASLDLQTVFGKVTAQIEFLQVGADGNTAAQAFRFLGMDDSCTGRLRAAIERMQSAGYSDAEIGQDGLSRVVSKSLATVRDYIQRLFQTGSLRRKVRARS